MQIPELPGNSLNELENYGVMNYLGLIYFLRQRCQNERQATFNARENEMVVRSGFTNFYIVTRDPVLCEN